MKIVVERIGKRRRAPSWGDEVWKAIDQAIEREVKPELQKRFGAVVANWQHKPTFVVRKLVSTKEIAISVYATGRNKNIWDYVSRGTRPHVIRPVRAKALRFTWGGPGSYRPKTTAHPLKWGGPGTVSGGETVYRQEVHHPGSEGRHFEEAIGSLYAGRFALAIRTAIRRGLTRASQGQAFKGI